MNEHLIDQQPTGGVNDGDWHSLRLSLRADSTLTTYLDGIPTASVPSPLISDFTSPDQIDTIYIGGTPSNELAIPFYDGCIYSFDINDQSLPIPSTEGRSDIFALSMKSLSGGVTSVPGCHSSNDVCLPNPCASGEYCNDIW